MADCFAAVAQRHASCAHLVGLYANIFGRVGRTDHQDALVRKLFGTAEIVCVLDNAGECFDTRKTWYVRMRKVPGGHDDLIKI